MKAQLCDRRARAGNKIIIFLIPAILLAVILAGLLATGTAQAATAYTIRDDATGGDCVAIGLWNASTKTCTLTTDLTVTGTDGIVIDSSNLTLDGNGHVLTGNQTNWPSISGVYALNQYYGTIRNLKIDGFTYGMSLPGCGHFTISRNTIINGYRDGIFLTWGGDNSIVNNIISSNGGRGYYGDAGILIFFNASAGNTITGNVITGNSTGIEGQAAMYNLIVGNTIKANGLGICLENGAVDYGPPMGMVLIPSNGNSVYKNSMIDNSVQAVSSFSTNEFDHWPLDPNEPVTGNYWSSFDTPDEGCYDVDPADGFCDQPYEFNPANLDEDYHPYSSQGQLARRPALSLGAPSPYWASYEDYVERELSVTWMVTNNGGVDASDVRLTGSNNSQGVTLSTELPADISSLISSSGGSASLQVKYHIPESVGMWHTINTACALDPEGTAFTYP
jgi:parallel beta-helix repeat protein